MSLNAVSPRRGAGGGFGGVRNVFECKDYKFNAFLLVGAERQMEHLREKVMAKQVEVSSTGDWGGKQGQVEMETARGGGVFGEGGRARRRASGVVKTRRCGEMCSGLWVFISFTFLIKRDKE